MLDGREDQAAGLRRLFRRAPPKVVALYAGGRRAADNAAPVADFAASEHKNTAKAATSSASTKRRVGCAARITSRITRSSGMLCTFA